MEILLNNSFIFELLTGVILVTLTVLMIVKYINSKTRTKSFFVLFLANIFQFLTLVLIFISSVIEDNQIALIIFCISIVAANQTMILSGYFTRTLIKKKSKTLTIYVAILAICAILAIITAIRLYLYKSANNFVDDIIDGGAIYYDKWFILSSIVIDSLFTISSIVVLFRYKKHLQNFIFFPMLLFCFLIFVDAFLAIYTNHYYINVIVAVFMVEEIMYFIHQDTLQEQRQKYNLLKNRTDEIIAQLQPGILFNSLNAMKDIENKNEYKDKMNSFSEFLRYNISCISRTDFVPFKDELAYIREFVNLEKLRFGEKIDVKYNLKALNFYIPAFTVEPFVENAIKYGYMNKGKDVVVNIESKRENGFYVILIKDNSGGFDTRSLDEKSGGINRVKTNLLNKVPNSTFDIVSKIGEGTTVTIKIPAKDIK